MTDSKQSALARRLAEKLNEYPTNTVNNLVETVNNLTQTTNNSIVQTQQQLENLKSYSEGTGSLLTYHLDLENSNSFNTRITNLENAPPSGGGGGIDPTDPEPVLISENYVSQMQNWASAGGSIQILSFNGYGEFVSPRIFQTLGTVVGFGNTNNMYIVAAASETDHAGVIEIVVEDDVTGVLSLSSNATGTVCVPADITRMIAIVKTPTSFPTNSSFIVGFATDLGAPTEGIYFVANPATNTWIPTVNNGSSTSTGTTTALATNTWYTLEISKVTSSSFDFTINGTTVNINTNVPTDPLNCGLWIDNATGANNTQLKVKLDFFSLKLREDAGGVLPAGATVEGTLNEVDVAYNSTTQVYTVGLPNEVTVENLNVDSIDFDTAPATSNALARLQWDNDYKTVRLGMTSSINAPLGQSLYKRVRNSSNTTAINLGEVLYINGSQGATVLQVGLADASSELTAATTIGIAAENIAANGTGMIILQGLLTGLNTNAYSPGDLVWLSTTAGAWTTTRPTAPDHGVFLGWIVKSAGAPDGSIYVKVANGQELYELHDVKITSIANNDVLQWDNTDLRWENRSLSAAGIASSGHTHTLDDLSDVTITSVASNNLIQYNGTGWINRSITAAGIMPDPTSATNPVYFVEDFLQAGTETGEVGLYNWNLANGQVTAVNSELNHPGVCRYRCSGTANTVSWLSTSNTNNNTTAQFHIDDVQEFTIVFKDVQTDLDTYRTYGLLADATNTAGQPNGIYLQKGIVGVSAGSWSFVCQRNTVSRTSVTWQTQDTSWHKIRVVITASQVDFYADGATSPTASITTNIPTSTTLAPFIILTPTGPSLVRTVDFDFFSYKLRGITR
jgi:hypothetical protein